MIGYDPHAMDWDIAAEKVKQFLDLFLATCGMEVAYVLRVDADSERARLGVVFTGPDARLLTARSAELLHAMEGVARAILRLAPEENDWLSFDAEDFKAAREQQVRRMAEMAEAAVRATGRPYSFQPMNSHERRMLHLELAKSGLRTASSGELSRRFVVVYPPGPVASAEDGAGRARVIRNAFRPR